MKKNLKILGFTLIVSIAILACNKSEFSPIPDLEEQLSKSQNENPATNDSIIFGSGNLTPLTGTLTNIVSENFESGGQAYYCYQLKLEKFYPAHVIYPNGGERVGGNNSYSINFKFFSAQDYASVDEVLKIEFQDDLLSYYKALVQSYATDKKTLGFLYGDRTLDPEMDGKEYINSLNSQVRIKSGDLHITKSGDSYMISFEGETETGEVVRCDFNDKIAVGDDIQMESFEEDFSLIEPLGSYIKKGSKYYKLVDGYYYVFNPASYEGSQIQTVQVISWRDYYWYEYDTNDKNYSDIIGQHWKSNALFLQFQFSSISQFTEKTYQVAPSDGIYSIGYGLGASRNIPLNGFPNDSHVVGYYHIATDTPYTFTYDEDPNYMKSQIALKSGQLQVSKNKMEIDFDGSFTDANGSEVHVKLKAIPCPWQFEW